MSVFFLFFFIPAALRLKRLTCGLDPAEKIMLSLLMLPVMLAVQAMGGCHLPLPVKQHALHGLLIVPLWGASLGETMVQMIQISEWCFKVGKLYKWTWQWTWLLESSSEVVAKSFPPLSHLSSIVFQLLTWLFQTDEE